MNSWRHKLGNVCAKPGRGVPVHRQARALVYVHVNTAHVPFFFNKLITMTSEFIDDMYGINEAELTRVINNLDNWYNEFV